jgi:hypothetical protein
MVTLTLIRGVSLAAHASSGFRQIVSGRSRLSIFILARMLGPWSLHAAASNNQEDLDARMADVRQN